MSLLVMLGLTYIGSWFDLLANDMLTWNLFKNVETAVKYYWTDVLPLWEVNILIGTMFGSLVCALIQFARRKSQKRRE